MMLDSIKERVSTVVVEVGMYIPGGARYYLLAWNVRLTQDVEP